MQNQILNYLGLGILMEKKVKQKNNENKIQDNGYLWRGLGRDMSLGWGFQR